MNITKYMTYVLLILTLVAGLSVTAKIQASDKDATGELYLASGDVMADLAAGFTAARENDKLLLVVMGANWCHDSRALASRLNEEPLSTIVNQRYETLFIDVGYLEKGKEVITSLGIPVYYATPTVLIVDPVSKEVVNEQNRHQWGDAANISMEESVEYFGQFSNTDQTTLQSDMEVDEQLQQLFVEIEAFEQTQAERLYQAYAVLAPMLKAYKEGDKDAFSEANWTEVREYRYKIPKDVEVLRAEAHTRVAAGETDIKLSYPVYPAFSWDTP